MFDVLGKDAVRGLCAPLSPGVNIGVVDKLDWFSICTDWPALVVCTSNRRILLNTCIRVSLNSGPNE